VRNANASTLKTEFDSLNFHDGESVDDFSTHIGQITNQPAIFSFEDKLEEIVRRFLQALPSKFEQVAASIETLLDLETITIDGWIGRLKPSEERINGNSKNAVARLNRIEDELVVQLSSRLNMSGNGGPNESCSSSGNGGHGCSAATEIEVEMMLVIMAAGSDDVARDE
jgi:hypothetical protein